MWISMPELVGVLGKDMARTLARHQGGVSVYVPARLLPGHPLEKIIGLRGMVALCAAYGGGSITIPNGRQEPQKERVARLLAEGRSRREVALECGVTERYVYMVAELTPKQEQLRLW